MRTELDLNECEHFLKANLDQSDIESSWIVLSENGDLISMIDLSKICAPAQVSRSNLHTYNNLTSCYRPTRSNLQQLCPSSRYQARCMRSNGGREGEGGGNTEFCVHICTTPPRSPFSSRTV